MVVTQTADCRKCFRCRKPRHIARDCIESALAEEQMHTMVEGNGGDMVERSEKSSSLEAPDVDDEDAAYFFGQHVGESGYGLSRDWLLLDSQSSTDMFCNDKYQTDIQDAPQPIVVHCNAGATKCRKEGFFPPHYSEKYPSNTIRMGYAT